MDKRHLILKTTSVEARSRRRARPVAASAALGVLMSIILASTTLGASWDPYIPVREGDLDGGNVGYPGGLAVLPANNAVVIYSHLGDYSVNSGAYIRRSTNSGLAWGAPLTLSTESTGGLGIAGRGTRVDAVWVDERDVPANAKVLYARSTNAGATFAPAQVIASPASGFPRDVSVARGPDATVAIAWTVRNGSSFYIRVRVSHDGGVSFGPGTTLATGNLREVKLAIGDGVIYAAYIRQVADGSRRLQMRTSPNNGTSWTAQAILASDVHTGFFLDYDTMPTITAEGDKAYVGYVNTADQLWYRRTVNRGATWSMATQLSGVLRTLQAAITVQDGVVRVAYTQNAAGGGDDIRFRRSNDGVTWSSPQNVAHSGIGNHVAGVGLAGKPIVLYMLPPDGSFGPFGTYVAVKH